MASQQPQQQQQKRKAGDESSASPRKETQSPGSTAADLLRSPSQRRKLESLASSSSSAAAAADSSAMAHASSRTAASESVSPEPKGKESVPRDGKSSASPKSMFTGSKEGSPMNTGASPAVNMMSVHSRPISPRNGSAPAHPTTSTSPPTIITSPPAISISAPAISISAPAMGDFRAKPVVAPSTTGIKLDFGTSAFQPAATITSGAESSSSSSSRPAFSGISFKPSKPIVVAPSSASSSIAFKPSAPIAVLPSSSGSASSSDAAGWDWVDGSSSRETLPKSISKETLPGNSVPVGEISKRKAASSPTGVSHMEEVRVPIIFQESPATKKTTADRLDTGDSMMISRSTSVESKKSALGESSKIIFGMGATSLSGKDTKSSQPVAHKPSPFAAVASNGSSFASVSASSSVSANDKPSFFATATSTGSVTKPSPFATFASSNEAPSMFGASQTQGSSSFAVVAQNQGKSFADLLASKKGNGEVADDAEDDAEEDGSGDDQEEQEDAGEQGADLGPPAEVFTGEEDEVTAFKANATVKFLDAEDKKWKQKGVGPLHINVKRNDDGLGYKARAVARHRGSFAVILNVSLFPAMSVRLVQERTILLGAIEFGRIVTYAVQLESAEVAQSAKTVLEQLRSTESIEGFLVEHGLINRVPDSRASPYSELQAGASVYGYQTPPYDSERETPTGGNHDDDVSSEGEFESYAP